MSREDNALVDAELVEEGKGFESISRDALQDGRLSFKARGIMAYLKSKPPRWKTSTRAIAADSDCDGYESVNNGIKELEALGYMARLKRRGDRGRWEWLWVYGDNPAAIAKRVARWQVENDALTARGGPASATPPQVNGTKPSTMSGKPVHGEAVHGQAGDGGPVSGEPRNKREIQRRDPEREERTTSPTAPPPREDVEQLCRLLRDKMIGNGCRPPTVTDTWRNAARLLLDKDGRDLGKAMRLLDWATSDEFWMANIQSMGKFRAQYDTLRLRANADYERQRRTNTATVRPSTTDARFMQQLNDHQQWFNPDGSMRSDLPLPDRSPARQLPSASPHGVHA